MLVGDFFLMWYFSTLTQILAMSKSLFLFRITKKKRKSRLFYYSNMVRPIYFIKNTKYFETNLFQ